MASQARIQANRRNALRSTGPKSPEGKAAVSRNALKHGFAARDIGLSPEAVEEIIQCAREYCRSFRPDGPRETLKVLRFAIAARALARLPEVEDALFARCTPANGFRPLNTLARYRSQLEASFYRALHELESLRAAPRKVGRTKPTSTG